jgi:hypothetical protein
VVVINKVDRLPDRKPARETAERLLSDGAIHAVILAALRRDDPVIETHTR